MNELIRINEADAVAVALRPLTAGEKISVAGAGFELDIREDITMGHKVALRDIHKGEPIIKYGYPIGEAIEEIK
ncbi:MAG: UxaA family hydrolase, partial [Synergistaceae bacterium]|nr:UxaA family hydrolase [Synergistaceae bacterium]